MLLLSRLQNWKKYAAPVTHRDLQRNTIMTKYSEQDLKYAAEFREEIHEEALARVKAVFPDADHVVDEYPADAYFHLSFKRFSTINP